MSGFTNPTNARRGAKMIDILDLIEKSAVSNKAPLAELKAMLQPLLDRLYGDSAPALGNRREEAPEASPEAPRPMPKPGTHAAYNSIREMAEQADLKDALLFLTVYTDRLGSIVYDQEKKT